jgi:dockerin type I repeat protein
MNGGVDTSIAQTFTINVKKAHVLHNAAKPADVTGDGQAAPNDLTALISYLNGNGAKSVASAGVTTAPYLDVDADGTIAPKDIVAVITYLNSYGAGEGEASAPGSTEPAFPYENTTVQPRAPSSLPTDELFALLAADTVSQPKRRP